MRRVIAAVVAGLLGLVMALPATGGAWPRDRGGWFLSSSVTMTRSAQGSVDGRSKVYLEYGIGHGWTLVLDAERPFTGGHEEVATLMHGLSWPSRWGVTSWGFGLGRRQVPGAPGLTYLHPTLAWGRGFAAGRWLPWPGWVSAEASAELWRAPRAMATKLDLTLGVKPGAGWMAIVQARFSTCPGTPWRLRLVPALTHDLSRHTRLEIAPGLTLRGGHDRDLEIALWTKF